MSSRPGAALKRLGASPAASLALIGASTSAVAAGFFAPGLRVYGSLWFWALGALAACALTYTVALQAGVLLRARRGPVAIDKCERTAAGLLAGRGYRLSGALGIGEKRALLFEKNAAGRYGSLVFHAGLLVVVISGLRLAAFQKRAFLQLIEGETFNGTEEEFLKVTKGPLAGGFSTPLRFRLDALTHEYWENGQPRELFSRVVRLDDGRGGGAIISVNHPLIAGGVAVHQSPYVGYSVSLALERPDGSRPTTHFLLNRAPRPDLPAYGEADFPMTDYFFNLYLRADRSRKDFHLAAPELEVIIAERGRVVYRGPVPLKGSVRVGKDRVFVAGLRQWSGFDVVDRGGLGAAYLGFFAAVSGAGLLFGFPRREMVVRAGPDRAWKVSSCSRGEKALAQEEAMVIERELAALCASGRNSRACLVV